MTRVSVVVPTYNRADFIRATIESILSQTLQPLEVIIVDDGSTDHTAEVCAQFKPPVSYIRRQNQGVSAARNAGIELAKGDWIAFCDSDDLWDPKKLELQITAIDATKAEWCVTDFRVIDPDGHPVRPEIPGMTQVFHPMKDSGGTPAKHFASWLRAKTLPTGSATVTVYHGDFFGMLFLGNVVLPSTAIVARALIERAGPFDPKLRRAEETEFFLRIAAKAPGVLVMEILASYRVGHASIMTGDVTPFIESALKTINEAASRRGSLTARERQAFQQGRSKLRLKLAYARLGSYDQRGARRALREAWREDRSFSLRSAAIMFASFLPQRALMGLHWAKRAISGRRA